MTSSLKQWFSTNQERFHLPSFSPTPPPTCLETCLDVTAWYLVGRSQEFCYTSYNAQDGSPRHPNKELPAPNGSSSQVENPCFLRTHLRNHIIHTFVSPTTADTEEGPYLLDSDSDFFPGGWGWGSESRSSFDCLFAPS